VTVSNYGLIVSSAPFVHVKQSTASLVLVLLICLLPSLGWAVYLFGWSVLLTVGASILSAVVVEGSLNLLRKRATLRDGTAILTGVLIGFAMPPSVPLYVPVFSSAFAIGVVKWSFGGLGSNWMNPALSGIVFAHINWPGSLTGWKAPRLLTGVDGVTSVTPLSLLRNASAHAEGLPMDLLRGAGYTITRIDRTVTNYLNDFVFSHLGSRLPDGYIDLFLGIRPGSIGEVAGGFLLIGSLVLIARRVIRWEIPVSITVAYGILIRLFGLGAEPLFSGDIIFSIFTGSFLLVVFFSATDPVTSPMSRPAIVLSGVVIGALIFMFRRFSASSE